MEFGVIGFGAMGFGIVAFGVMEFGTMGFGIIVGWLSGRKYHFTENCHTRLKISGYVLRSMCFRFPPGDRI